MGAPYDPTDERTALAGGPHRPAYHFAPPTNWLNDPNGLIQFDGTYHLFYQHNPAEPVWGDIHWGHARSEDLLHWTDEPIALEPDSPNVDADGCFSGCAVDDDGVPTLVYTGIDDDRARQCLAIGDETFRRWEKPSVNPVVETPPPGVDRFDFRDPFVWREGDGWSMVVGAATESDSRVLLYRSSDLREWEYRGAVFVDDRPDVMWECPALVALGGRGRGRGGDQGRSQSRSWNQNRDQYLMLGSLLPTRAVRYYVGSYADERFEPRREGILDAGDFYAPQPFVDESGRIVLVGWVEEARAEPAQRAAGWSGLMALPRELSLDEDGRLRTAPVDEVRRLRELEYELPAVGPEDGTVFVDQPRSETIELVATVSETDTGTEPSTASLSVLRSPDGLEETVVRVDPDRGTVTVDRSRSSDDPAVETHEQTAHFEPTADPVTVRCFVDRSVVEVYADERACLTSRVYPTRADSTGIAISTDGASVDDGTVWELASVWDDFAPSPA
ncbi:glycoside hydrolase family 32 protein [Halobacteria archaeon AArc-m2/3/4]|uniref:beta-fructofuranosidase n=1 Tax=Natronoglomus mannanivorans TaxID=2979990 RepID=A0AAP2Z0M6_9EURY|nr:glycoside hydrolase family 32 protein [Halobacteria archaeon AArc-xg1-1]MCU4973844.1 glycoside hydrolase family 32 protein [Halobacteria archaeon AArc-m2/3/4]